MITEKPAKSVRPNIKAVDDEIPITAQWPISPNHKKRTALPSRLQRIMGVSKKEHNP
jgi:hypothetical protein